MKLAASQRRALARCVAQGIPANDKHINPAAITVLEEHGLIRLTTNRRKRATWQATSAGRAIVASWGMQPVFLHRQSQYGYTAQFGRALAWEPEAFWYDGAPEA